MAGTNFFEYASSKRSGDDEISDRLGAIETALGIQAQSPLQSYLGGGVTKEKKGKGGGLGTNKLFKIGNIPIKQIQRTEKDLTQSAPDYAEFLAGQVSRGERSPIEASDLYADFGLAYGIPDAFKTASTLGSMAMGAAPEGVVERYRPFQQFAAQQLGINLSEQDIKSTEAAARALGKTSPEAFSQFLGQKMLTSPEYIRKTPLAFAANLPFGGQYGVGYSQPNGTQTGTYRFKPPSTVDYS
jgi:hypothetical protein